MKNQQQLVMLMIDVCLSADFLIIFQVDNESLTNFQSNFTEKVKNSQPENYLPDKNVFRTQLKKA